MSLYLSWIGWKSVTLHQAIRNITSLRDIVLSRNLGEKMISLTFSIHLNSMMLSIQTKDWKIGLKHWLLMVLRGSQIPQRMRAYVVKSLNVLDLSRKLTLGKEVQWYTEKIRMVFLTQSKFKIFKLYLILAKKNNFMRNEPLHYLTFQTWVKMHVMIWERENLLTQNSNMSFILKILPHFYKHPILKSKPQLQRFKDEVILLIFLISIF